jgi:penicillin-binding protein 1C
MAAPLMFGLFNSLPASDWLEMPTYALKRIEICANDGFLANGDCEPETTWMPRDSHFDALSPHNLRVRLEATQRFRVDGDCESPSAMTHVTWFVLPPAEEYYYRKSHAEYRPLPPARADCQGNSGRPGLALLYPDQNSRVVIPRELDGQRGRTIFEAVSRRREATIYWHLDGQYLGETHTFHQQSLDIDPGEHILTVVDDEGERVARRFQVIAARNGFQ